MKGVAMNRARIDEGARRMRFASLLDRQEQGEITQTDAAEMPGSMVRLRSAGPVVVGDIARLGSVCSHDGANEN